MRSEPTAESDPTLPNIGDVLLDRVECWMQRALDAEARERALVEENRRLRATFGVVMVGGATG